MSPIHSKKPLFIRKDELHAIITALTAFWSLQQHGLPSAGALSESQSRERLSARQLCIRALTSLAEANNMAACHACVLAPETGCEEYNSFLDRALLVGLPEDRSVGFFADLLNMS